MEFTETSEILMLCTWGAVTVTVLLIIPAGYALIRRNQQEIQKLKAQRPTPDVLTAIEDVSDPHDLLGKTIRVDEHRWMAKELLAETSSEEPGEESVVPVEDGTFVPGDHEQTLKNIYAMEARLGLISEIPAQERADGPLPIRPPKADPSQWDAPGEIVRRAFNGEDGSSIDPDQPTDVGMAAEEP
jgi:hypothetical protein